MKRWSWSLELWRKFPFTSNGDSSTECKALVLMLGLLLVSGSSSPKEDESDVFDFVQKLPNLLESRCVVAALLPVSEDINALLSTFLHVSNIYN